MSWVATFIDADYEDSLDLVREMSLNWEALAEMVDDARPKDAERYRAKRRRIDVLVNVLQSAVHSSPPPVVPCLECGVATVGYLCGHCARGVVEDAAGVR